MKTRTMACLLAAMAALAGGPRLCAAVTNGNASAAAQDARPKKKISPQKLRETIRRVQEKKTGGIIRLAGSARGVFVILNAQKKVPADAIAPVTAALDKAVRVQTKLVDGAAAGAGPSRWDAAIKAAGGTLGVAIVDGDGPALTVAPEDGWAVVDVSRLAKDAPDAAKLASRVRKEVMRAFAFVGGGAYVARGEPLMRDIRSARDLDAFDVEQFGIEETVHLRDSVSRYGLVPWHQATYKKACEEGWAPAPTNEYQKAIWEKAKADKERGPTNPITIQPPKK